MITRFSSYNTIGKSVVDVFAKLELCSFFIILPILSLKFGIEFPFAVRFDFKDLHLKLDIFRGMLSVVTVHIIVLVYEVAKNICNFVAQYSSAYINVTIDKTMRVYSNEINMDNMDLMNPFLYSTRTEGLLE